MAKYGSADVAVMLVGEYDILAVDGTAMEASDAIETATDDTKGLSMAWPVPVSTGVLGGTVTFSGLYDDLTGGINDMLSTAATSRVMSWAFAGGVVGDTFYGAAGVFNAAYERVSQIGKLHRAKGTYNVSGNVDKNGLILAAQQTVTTDGETESSSQDNAASSAAGGAGYFHITDLTLDTATGLTLYVIDSSNDVTFGPLITLSAQTAVGGTRSTVSGTVERYVAAEWAWDGGAGGSSTADIFIGFKRD